MTGAKIIQAIAMALKVVCIVMIVFYGIAALASGLGLLETVFSESSRPIARFMLEEYLGYNARLSLTELRVILIGSIVAAVAEILVLLFLSRYFKHELKAGSPFTFEGAKELLWVGIKALIIFAVAMAICCVTRLIAFGNTDLPEIETEMFQVSRHGAELILLSLLLRFGAEETRRSQK
ncbi:MAG: hypothetical protein E7434_01225 [Ruminococcaceae bacterium]|nr:hypothetical protein [Oscillospiraceae bacterium]